MKNGRYQLKDVPIVDVLRAVKEEHQDPAPLLERKRWWLRCGLDKLPPKLCWLKVENDKDFLDYGVSARCPWLTEMGEAALEAV